MASHYIEDGFTVEDTFDGKGWQSSFKFRYRPALPKRFHKYWADRNDDPKAAHRLNVNLIMEHIDSWDLKDSKGVGLQPKMASVYDRLSVQAQQFMVNCILGNGPDHADMDMDEAAKNSPSPSA